MFRDLAGGQVLGAFEKEMLQKMRGSRLGIRFIPSTRVNPAAEGNGTDAGHRFGDYPQPTRERGEIKVHGRMIGLATPWARNISIRPIR
jgi:hypothetical protein